MDTNKIVTAFQLSANIEKLERIKTALEMAQPSQSRSYALLIARSLEEVNTVTSIVPVIEHLKALVDGTLDAQKDVLANL